MGGIFDHQLNQQSIPNNLAQLNIINLECVKINKIELEISYWHTNINYNKSRIRNLFIWGHDNKISITQINSDEYVIKDELNDYINDEPVTKIKLIPKMIIQPRIKSAKKLIY